MHTMRWISDDQGGEPGGCHQLVAWCCLRPVLSVYIVCWQTSPEKRPPSSIGVLSTPCDARAECLQIMRLSSAIGILVDHNWDET